MARGSPSPSSSGARASILLLLVVVAALLSPGVVGCFLQGVDSGVCKAAADTRTEMPFCGPVVTYTACVPKEYAYFPNHTLAKKDSWARKTYQSVMKRRMDIETGVFPVDIGEGAGRGRGRGSASATQDERGAALAVTRR
jgi:hypothetical protein